MRFWRRREPTTTSAPLTLGEMLKQAQTAQLSHPVPVLRAREMMAGQVQKIMNLCLDEIDSVCY